MSCGGSGSDRGVDSHPFNGEIRFIREDLSGELYCDSISHVEYNSNAASWTKVGRCDCPIGHRLGTVVTDENIEEMFEQALFAVGEYRVKPGGEVPDVNKPPGQKAPVILYAGDNKIANYFCNGEDHVRYEFANNTFFWHSVCNCKMKGLGNLSSGWEKEMFYNTVFLHKQDKPVPEPEREKPNEQTLQLDRLEEYNELYLEFDSKWMRHYLSDADADLIGAVFCATWLNKFGSRFWYQQKEIPVLCEAGDYEILQACSLDPQTRVVGFDPLEGVVLTLNEEGYLTLSPIPPFIKSICKTW